MKKVLIYLGITVLAVFTVAAQDSETLIFGSIKNKQTDKPLPNAVITVKGTQINVHSDATGHFEIHNLKEGKYTLTASFIGYTSLDKEVTLQKNSPAHVQFFLDKNSVNLEQVVITGTRTEHFVKDVPIRTEVLTSESITQKNAQNVLRLWRQFPE